MCSVGLDDPHAIAASSQQRQATQMIQEASTRNVAVAVPDDAQLDGEDEAESCEQGFGAAALHLENPRKQVSEKAGLQI